MMRKTILAVAAVTLITAGFTNAGVSIVMNGSFENDGHTIDYITPGNAPYRWCDVSLPATKFDAAMWSDWSTHGDYYVTIHSYYRANFNVNDMGTISQDVFLQDVNEIIFDLRLNTAYNQSWNPAIRSAILLIDNEAVWESNSVGTDVRGEYLNQIYVVEERFKDANSHKLSLGLRANVSGTPWIDYYADWDFVKFNTYCGGFGYMAEDFDRDCRVDINDLGAMAGEWLVADPNEKYDLFADGAVNFQDYAYFAEYWRCTTRWENWQDSNFIETELPVSDMDNSGRVDYGDILLMGSAWLTTGDCINSDLNRDRKVDFKDFTILNSQWLEKSWVFYVAE